MFNELAFTWKANRKKIFRKQVIVNFLENNRASLVLNLFFSVSSRNPTSHLTFFKQKMSWSSSISTRLETI